MVGNAIEFWFDFSSPYAYFAGLEVDSLARRHGREVHWRPFLLGVVFRTTGNAPLTHQPLKGEYSRRDWARLARLRGLPFVLRPDFPIRSQVPARLVYAAAAMQGEHCAGELAHRFLRAMFGEGLDIADAGTATGIATDLIPEASWLADAAADLRWKDALRDRTSEATARGIFGSPWLDIDGEAFWGGLSHGRTLA